MQLVAHMPKAKRRRVKNWAPTTEAIGRYVRTAVKDAETARIFLGKVPYTSSQDPIWRAVGAAEHPGERSPADMPAALIRECVLIATVYDAGDDDLADEPCCRFESSVRAGAKVCLRLDAYAKRCLDTSQPPPEITTEAELRTFLLCIADPGLPARAMAEHRAYCAKMARKWAECQRMLDGE
jgi:hypothetical protein